MTGAAAGDLDGRRGGVADLTVETGDVSRVTGGSPHELVAADPHPPADRSERAPDELDPAEIVPVTVD
jgi:hypothetical protein